MDQQLQAEGTGGGDVWWETEGRLSKALRQCGAGGWPHEADDMAVVRVVARDMTVGTAALWAIELAL